MVDINNRSRFQYYSKVSSQELTWPVTEQMLRKWSHDESIYVIEQTNDCPVRYELAAFIKKYL